MSRPPQGMRFIKGGIFRMGGLDAVYDSMAEARHIADSGYKTGGSHQLPSHMVEVGDFYMDSCEISEREWEKLKGPPPREKWGEEYPIRRATWYQAILYCNARSRQYGLEPVYHFSGFEEDTVRFSSGAFEVDSNMTGITIDMTANGFRLPTEAEFEYAARAGSDTKYPWGNAPDTTMGWWKRISANGKMDSLPHPVGTKKPNPWGLYDMIGNVGEWVNDGYEESREYYRLSPDDNPYGPDDSRRAGLSLLDAGQHSAGIFSATTGLKVFRGGDLDFGWTLVPSRFRSYVDPGSAAAGFRTVLQVR